MSGSINPYPLREIGELLSRLESAPAVLASLASGAVRRLLKLASAAPGWPGDVSKESVELLFWVHKAFLLGFIASMVLTSVRG